jgi:dihydroflavonol-4-reductase
MVAVVGATGHLGTVLVRRLVESGEQVRYVARARSRAPGLDGIAAERVQVDLSDVETLQQALQGVAVVYHAAARISISSSGYRELYEANVRGTRNLLAAAKSADVRRFVYIGSIEAYPLAQAHGPITEDDGFDPKQTTMLYGRTKALAMQLVARAGQEGMDTVTCCPTAFVGPPDYRLSPIGRLIVDYLESRLIAYVDGGFDFVDVRDVADGVIAAANRGSTGGVYLLSGRYVSIPRLMQLLQQLSGVRKPPFCFPCRALLPLMPVVETYYRLSGRPPRFTAGSLGILSLGVRVDSSRAVRELGYQARPIEETLADTVAWFRSNKDRCYRR